MQIHFLRENENIDDLSILYSVEKNKIMEANKFRGDKLRDKQVIIPCDDFYYFKKYEESIESILSKFDIAKEELYSLNKSPLCFKDGGIRLKLKQKKKNIKVYSLVDLTMGSNSFIEADLENSYVSSFMGYNVAYDDNDDIEDFYLKKISEIENKEVSLIIHNKVFYSVKTFMQYIDLKFDKKYYKEVNIYYDITKVDFDELIANINHSYFKFNIVLDIYLLNKVLENEDIVKKINDNFNKLFILPTYISDKKSLSYDEYKKFIEKINVFKRDKIAVGLNLNDYDNINLIELMKIINLIYNKDIPSLIIYSCSNRFFQISYILNHFFIINS
ncbi:hypothetical protein [Anaerofustis sp. NSJ-163]|uniref:hypothetical protein n=1 Tax=Anaerofustis sp. NSJ-163 TaxID=2944391 RepID=UPI00209C6297|nr:hypothetical protein [Anaerofustis sp. NSJ-163]MCO8194032.1 hypothetical protein [Anaerofustis sp. NSJ-163]